jgi:hypothetical protein
MGETRRGGGWEGERDTHLSHVYVKRLRQIVTVQFRLVKKGLTASWGVE